MYVPDVFDMLKTIQEIEYIKSLKLGKKVDKTFSADIRIEVDEWEIICASEKTDINYNITVNEIDSAV